MGPGAANERAGIYGEQLALLTPSSKVSQFSGGKIASALFTD